MLLSKSVFSNASKCLCSGFGSKFFFFFTFFFVSDLRLSLDNCHSFSHMMTSQAELIKKTGQDEAARYVGGVGIALIFVKTLNWMIIL